MKKKKAVATDDQIRDEIARFRALLDTHPAHNVWAFFSNKNSCLLTILGDIAFSQCVLLEGDPTVHRYEPASMGNTEGVLSDEHIVKAYYQDARKEWFYCGWRDATRSARRRCELERVEEACGSAGARLVLRDERDVAVRRNEIFNWLMLSGFMTRARDLSWHNEASVLAQTLSPGKPTSIKFLLDAAKSDPALMLAAIASGLARGRLYCDLTNGPLQLTSTISLEKSGAPARVIPPEQEPPHQHFISSPIPLTRRTKGIPELWRSLDRWPNAMPVRDSEVFRQRKVAIEMYVQGASPDDILRATGLSNSWVKTLYRRCLKPARDGRIKGFRALVRYTPERDYTRTAPEPPSNIVEGRHGGYAGLFLQLLQRFSGNDNKEDDLVALIEREVLNLAAAKRARPESRISWVNLHTLVCDYLKSKGVEETSYPFSVRDRAYGSLAKFCRDLIYARPYRFISARYGRNAARRAQIDQWSDSLFEARQVFEIVSLDFQKVDAVTTVEMEVPKFDQTIDVPVERWQVGAVADDYSHCLIGVTDSGYPQTTEDCVMDLVESAINPPLPDDRLAGFPATHDGRWLPNQLLAKTAFQAWDILRLDRAWAHKSTDFIASLISTVGCALCFGGAGKWWLRTVIERRFREMTRMGPQSLASTLGSGPGDSRRNEPVGKAVQFRIRRQRVWDLTRANVRWLNEDASSGLMYGSAFRIMRSAVEDEMAKRFFPRPLPLPRRHDYPLMWKTLPLRVNDTRKSGEPPCVRLKSGARFGCRELVRAWRLIGEPAMLKVLRRDINRSRLVIVRTGEVIEGLRPEKKWRGGAVTWRDFDLIETWGRHQKRADRRTPPVRAYLEETGAEVVKKTGGKTPRNDRRMAANHDRIKRNAAQGKTAPSTDPTASATVKNTPARESFGSVPAISAFTRGKRRGS